MNQSFNPPFIERQQDPSPGLQSPSLAKGPYPDKILRIFFGNLFTLAPFCSEKDGFDEADQSKNL